MLKWFSAGVIFLCCTSTFANIITTSTNDLHLPTTADGMHLHSPVVPGITFSNPLNGRASTYQASSTLKNRGFYTLAMSKQVHKNIDISLSYLDHERFNYQKSLSIRTPSNIHASKTNMRYFDLNDRAIMVNGFLHPAQHLYDILGVALTPYAGGGIGYAHEDRSGIQPVFNHQSTAKSKAISPFSSLVGPHNLAWQGAFGFDIHPEKSPLSVDLGYRYFGAGKISSNENLNTNNNWINLPSWTGNLTANQLFVEFKYRV